jgi:hypothetical protein
MPVLKKTTHSFENCSRSPLYITHRGARDGPLLGTEKGLHGTQSIEVT